jgi:hypothetical protein
MFDKSLNLALNRLASVRASSQSTTKRAKSTHLMPISFGRIQTTLGRPKTKGIRILFDSGSSQTHVKRSFAKKLNLRNETVATWNTAAGQIKTSERCVVHFSLPEFSPTRTIAWDMHVGTLDNVHYDMIIGNDLLETLKIDLKYSTSTIDWDGIEIPMRSKDATPEDSYIINESSPLKDASRRVKEILDAKYEPANLEEVAAECTNLDDEQREDLHRLLKKYESLFDGTLGQWKGEDYDIELKEGATPYHARPFPIPRIHEQTLRHEVDRLCEIGVLKKVNRSEWAAPTFIIPKKDGTVRFISDFRQLNKRIKRKPFPIPKIQDLLLKLEGFQYATSLDLNMGYYHIELSPDSKRLCTIVLPWGKYEYQKLPMGLCNSPDIFQEKMSTLFSDLEFIRTYIDDLLVITKSDWHDHLRHLDIVFKRLRDAGLKVNARKSFFGKEELEYLGYWIMRAGIQPIAKK